MSNVFNISGKARFDAIDAAIVAKSSRGTLILSPEYNAVPGDTVYHDVVNLTGVSGILIRVFFRPQVTSGYVQLTVDGITANDQVAGDAYGYLQFAMSLNPFYFTDNQGLFVGMNIEFNDSLRVEIKADIATNAMRGRVLYSLDT